MIKDNEYSVYGATLVLRTHPTRVFQETFESMATGKNGFHCIVRSLKRR